MPCDARVKMAGITKKIGAVLLMDGAPAILAKFDAIVGFWVTAHDVLCFAAGDGIEQLGRFFFVELYARLIDLHAPAFTAGILTGAAGALKAVDIVILRDVVCFSHDGGDNQPPSVCEISYFACGKTY